MCKPKRTPKMTTGKHPTLPPTNSFPQDHTPREDLSTGRQLRPPQHPARTAQDAPAAPVWPTGPRC